MTKEEYLRRRTSINNEEQSLWNAVKAHSNEERRVIDILGNAENILDEFDKTFEENTSLNKVDWTFLMFATALQILRIYLLPKFWEKLQDDERLPHDDKTIKDMEYEEIQKYKDKHIDKWESKKSEKGYRSWQEIAFTIKVPYDATKHSGVGFNDRNMHGGKHRVKTLGHDPWLGWIFGVGNIITDTISICPEYKLGEKRIRIPYIETYDVDMSTFSWGDKSTTISMFEDAIESIKEDRHRLYAAVFAQTIHLASDINTKMGLPIPFLTLIDSDKAYEIYSSGYDYIDLEFDTQILRRTMKSAAQAMIINAIISCIHGMFYNPKEGISRELYSVKTHKILMYSNVIATSSDIVQTIVRSVMGDENALKNFDIGGFLVTLYRIVKDVETIQKIKEEFIFKKWDNLMFNK